MFRSEPIKVGERARKDEEDEIYMERWQMEENSGSLAWNLHGDAARSGRAGSAYHLCE